MPPIAARPAPFALARWACLFILGSTAVVFAAQTAPAAGQDWPIFRGPNRTGISLDSAIKAPWPDEGPKTLWKVAIGEGYSGVAVVGNKVYTVGNKDEKDTVYCLDAEKGTVLWSQTYDCPKAGSGYSGPRATPTVDNGVVYTLSNNGILNAYNADKGTPVFTKNIAKEVGAKAPNWGHSASVLVDGNNLILNLNTHGVAVRKADGVVAWKSPEGTCGYSTPLPCTLGNRKCVLLFSSKELVAIDPANGNKLWAYPWETRYDVNAADPIVSGTQIFISSNYKKGGALLELASGQPVKVWENNKMKNHFNASVLIDGFLYGNSEGTLTCMDWKTGEVKWTGKEGIDKGGLTAVGKQLVVLSAKGQLMLIEADSTAYKLVSKAQVIGGECWTSPAVVAGRVYCRSHDGDLVCVDVKK